MAKYGRATAPGKAIVNGCFPASEEENNVRRRPGPGNERRAKYGRPKPGPRGAGEGSPVYGTGPGRKAYVGGKPPQRSGQQAVGGCAGLEPASPWGSQPNEVSPAYGTRSGGRGATARAVIHYQRVGPLRYRRPDCRRAGVEPALSGTQEVRLPYGIPDCGLSVGQASGQLTQLLYRSS